MRSPAEDSVNVDDSFYSFVVVVLDSPFQTYFWGIKTRSGPKIPAAGYSEEERVFGFKDIDSDFGCCYEQFWNFVRTTKFWNFVRTSEFWLFSRSWIFGLLALRMALKVNSDLRFKNYGPFPPCKHDFMCGRGCF